MDMQDTPSGLECLQSQLEEIEAAEAVWAGALQLAGVERDNLRLAQLVASGASSLYGPADVAELSGTVCLPSERPGGPPVQLRFQFPKAYPLGAALKAQACTEAPRPQAEAIQREVDSIIAANEGGLCLLLALDAARGAAASVAGAEAEADAGCSGAAAAAAAAAGAAEGRRPRRTLARKIIWFHHIKNINKRKAIVEWAHELQLGGASKPGFPGMVVVEGASEDVDEYISRLKGLRWQAMSVRGEELEELEDSCSGGSASLPAGAAAAGAAAAGPAAAGGRRKFGRFAEVPGEDMSRFAALCREAGAEPLFLAALKLQ